MLILSKNYDGRTGAGREAWFALDYNGDGSGWFTLTLRGTGWNGLVPELADRAMGGPDGYRWGIDRVYCVPVSAGLLADWHALHAPRPIQFDWLADNTGGKFAAVAAMLADEFTDGDPITGWAAIAANGG